RQCPATSRSRQRSTKGGVRRAPSSYAQGTLGGRLVPRHRLAAGDERAGRMAAGSAPGSTPTSARSTSANDGVKKLSGGYWTALPPTIKFFLTTAPGKYVFSVRIPGEIPVPRMPYSLWATRLLVKTKSVLGGPSAVM